MKLTPLFAITLLSTLTLTVQANPNDGVVGAYARVEVGFSNFSLSSPLPQTATDDRGKAAKFIIGYRFTENLGIEGGYSALGSFSDNLSIGGGSAEQHGKARSIYSAATGRLPLNESFALHGRLGLSSGKVSGTNLLPETNNLMGSKSSVLIGVGAEYKPAPNVALTINYDSYGKLSNKVKANSLVFGAHFWF